ncbi:DNA polymerase III subunit chi [Vibrio tapetis subsp. quintayensis]|uniref:DNA polymerase III subunit chi n=1 Tax=Vibrio tapetis TaxID=52443 RepID=UPI0025B3893E|nr:DNA polymerase III subunit chi [Vibrio tapetis]MDN3680010.1 DNA polymerase III subunit chi [Vibrio tapetis subsp. quintayensis]
MATATFYIVKPESPQATVEGLLNYVVFLAQHFAKQGAKVYLNAESKQQAEQLAEHFWQLEPDNFTAHNLVGEGPRSGTSIEIGYTELKPNWNRQLVINLTNDLTNFAPAFAQVIDFVPCDEKAKQTARERFKIYRQAGYEMQTVEIHYP